MPDIRSSDAFAYDGRAIIADVVGFTLEASAAEIAQALKTRRGR
jgi:hypothetical protein